LSLFLCKKGNKVKKMEREQQNEARFSFDVNDSFLWRSHQFFA
jgi:hypothetical protein